MALPSGNSEIKASNMDGKNLILPFILVTSLFFFWAIAHNLNDILIRQFQKALDLNRGQSGFIQFAFYLGYFTMALPAGYAMKKWGYKAGIIFGLLLYALGAFMFWPAAEVRMYGFFLTALFIIAAGLTFLETAANPYITVLGDPSKSEQRLNFAQAFNGVGAAVAPVIGGIFIFSGTEHTAESLAALSTEQMEAYRTAEASAVQMPYLVIGIIVLALAVLFYFMKMPLITESETTAVSSGEKKSIFAHKHLVFGVLTEFLYVGAQVGVWSYFIDYMLEMNPASNEKEAANYLAICLTMFTVGRFVGTALMSKFKANLLLSIYAAINIVLLTVAFAGSGMMAVYALMAVSFFMSIMFPTIFALSIKGLGEQTKMGSSMVIMSIVGGAIFPPLMGYLADGNNVQFSMIVPLICFVAVVWYGLKGSKIKETSSDYR